MFGFFVIFCSFLMLLEIQAEEKDSENTTAYNETAHNETAQIMKPLFDKVIENQKQIRAMIADNIETQQHQNSRQLQSFLPETEQFLKKNLQSFRKLTISMRDEFQNIANRLQPLFNEEYDLQQLEFQKHLRDFLQEALDSINYHTKYCLAHITAEPGTSTECEQQQQWPDNCRDVATKIDGVTRIQVQKVNHLVFCDQQTLGGGWMLVLQRKSDAKNFQNTWHTHEVGFGQLCENDYFLGLHLLHKLTTARKHQLLIELKDEADGMSIARYDEILIGSAASGYQFMRLGSYSGTAGDSLRYVVGRKFATIEPEHDIDDCVSQYNATGWLMGGSECAIGNIFGNIFIGKNKKKYKRQSALTWPSFRITDKLEEIRMLIRVV